jgi:hypothetical protein
MAPLPILRELWRSHITAEDYDRHMAAVGQAQACASLVQEMLLQHPPRLGARVLFAGAGTGQCFDYFPASLLGRFRVTFTDVNATFLARLSGRVKGIDFSTAIDDIEAPRLAGPFDLAVVVLVLEHVDWRKAAAALMRQAARVFVVMQQNPPEPPPDRLRDTMALLAEARPTLLDRAQLVEAFAAGGFDLARTASREVADGKTLRAFDLVKPPQNGYKISSAMAAGMPSR